MSGILRTLRAWRQRRFAHALFLPVSVTLVTASLVGGPWPPALGLIARQGAAWLGVLALRLWDDLEDRQSDATEHPERVLTRVSSARPYALVVAGVLLIATLLTALGAGAAWVWPALAAGLFAFYRLRGKARAGGDFVVLLKYPVIAFALGANLEPVSLAALAVVLAAVCTDDALQARKPRRAAVVAGALALVAAACVMLVLTPEAPVAAIATQATMIAGMAAISLWSLFWQARPRLTRAGLLAMTFGTLLLSTLEPIHAS